MKNPNLQIVAKLPRLELNLYYEDNAIIVVFLEWAHSLQPLQKSRSSKVVVIGVDRSDGLGKVLVLLDTYHGQKYIMVNPQD